MTDIHHAIAEEFSTHLTTLGLTCRRITKSQAGNLELTFATQKDKSDLNPHLAHYIALIGTRSDDTLAIEIYVTYTSYGNPCSEIPLGLPIIEAALNDPESFDKLYEAIQKLIDHFHLSDNGYLNHWGIGKYSRPERKQAHY